MFYMLKCEDATHLGGPMGTEYTTTIFTKFFKSVDAAREYANQWYKNKWGRELKSDKWRDNGGRVVHCDTGSYIWTITEVEIEE